MVVCGFGFDDVGGEGVEVVWFEVEDEGGCLVLCDIMCGIVVDDDLVVVGVGFVVDGEWCVVG